MVLKGRGLLPVLTTGRSLAAPEKLGRLTAIANRARLRNRLFVNEKPKQHAVFRHAKQCPFPRLRPKTS
jgi:hypothetical protein